MDDQYFAMLQTTLEADYVPHLPPLLKPHKVDEENTRKNLSRAFNAFALSSACGISPELASKSIVDDFEDYGIDAIYYQGSTETLYLVQGKLKPSSQFDQAEALAFCQGVRKLTRQEFDDFNQHVQSRLIEIEGALEACSHIKLIVAHAGSGISQHAHDAILELLDEEDKEDERLVDSYDDFDVARTIAALHASKAIEKVDAVLTIHKCQSVAEPRQTYFGLIKLIDLVQLHVKYGLNLYERNIRTYLGRQTDVNIAIRETLAAKPEMFMYLNNGVTLLADIIEPKDNHKSAGKRLKLRGVSVINGAQTIATSAQFQADVPQKDISSARVLITVIKATTDGDFGKSVTRARNHQNPVVLANFAALDDEQERLRRELALLGLQYFYKGSAPDNTYDPNRIRIEEAAQALAVFHPDPRYAVWVKKEPGMLLDTERQQYKALFGGGLNGLKLANAVRVNRFVQARMRDEVVRSSGQDRLVYKHGGFAVAWIFSKRTRDAVEGNALLDESKLATQLGKPFDDLRQLSVDETKKCARGPLAVFRNQGEAIRLLRDIAIADYGLAADTVLGHKMKQDQAGQPYPEALFDYLVSKAPQIGNLA